MSRFVIWAKICAGKNAIGSSIQARSAGEFMSQQWRTYGLSDRDHLDERTDVEDEFHRERSRLKRPVNQGPEQTRVRAHRR